MNRDLDAEIVREIFRWKETPVGPDYDGKNACSILTEFGELPDDLPSYILPARGVIHPGFLAPPYSSNLETAIGLANRVGLRFDGPIPTNPETISQMALEHFRARKEKTNAAG